MSRRRLAPRCRIPGWRWVVKGRCLVLCDPDGHPHDAVGPRGNGRSDWLCHTRRFLSFRHRREAMDFAEAEHKIKWGIGVVIERLGRLARADKAKREAASL